MTEPLRPPTPTTAPSPVVWSRVWLFYGIAVGGAVLVTLLLVGIGQWAPDWAGVLSTVITACCYMTLPLVAGLIVERVSGEGYLIGREFRALRGRFWRTYLRSAGISLAVMVAILLTGFATSALTAGLPGAGHLATTSQEVLVQLQSLYPTLASLPTIPAVPILALVTICQGLLAGLTVNAVFAFGEEYGWRGVLADLLAGLGPVKASALTGVLWGFWHAPIIVLGHNYGLEWGWGIFVMVTWTLPLAYLHTWVRNRAGSLMAPSILHGAYNGCIGIFSLLVIGGNVLIAVPMGLWMGVGLSVLAVVLWRALPPTPRV